MVEKGGLALQNRRKPDLTPYQRDGRSLEFKEKSNSPVVRTGVTGIEESPGERRNGKQRGGKLRS